MEFSQNLGRAFIPHNRFKPSSWIDRTNRTACNPDDERSDGRLSMTILTGHPRSSLTLIRLEGRGCHQIRRVSNPSTFQHMTVLSLDDCAVGVPPSGSAVDAARPIYKACGGDPKGNTRIQLKRFIRTNSMPRFPRNLPWRLRGGLRADNRSIRQHEKIAARRSIRQHLRRRLNYQKDSHYSEGSWGSPMRKDKLMAGH